MHLLHPATDLAEVYLEFESLPDPCRPCWVVRADGATLITVDPRSSKIECTDWCVKNLTAAEANAYRDAFGGPPIGLPGPDSWTEDEPVTTVVPPLLQLGRHAHTPEQQRIVR